MYDVGSETRQVTEHAWAVAGPADRTTWAQVIRQARCADVSLDADEWFPVSTHPDSARREAAAAIAICDACPVRAQCLALSLRHWSTASTVSGAVWSQPNGRRCGAAGWRAGPGRPQPAAGDVTTRGQEFPP